MQPLPGLRFLRGAAWQADQGGAYEKRDGARGGNLQIARGKVGQKAEGRPGVHRGLFQARHKMGGIAGTGCLPNIAFGVGEGQEKQGQADEDGCPGLRSDSGGRLHQKPEEGHAKILPLFPAVFALAKEGRNRGQAGRVKEPIQEKPRLRLAFIG